MPVCSLLSYSVTVYSQVLSNVTTEVLVRKLNLLCFFERLLQSLGLVLAVAADSDDATAIGHLVVRCDWPFMLIELST